MANVVWHAGAEADYRAALAWYAQFSQQAADGFEAAVERTVRQIESMPNAYPMIDGRHRRCSVRRYPYGLVYRVEGDQVIVVAVAHDRQLPGYWASRT